MVDELLSVPPSETPWPEGLPPLGGPSETVDWDDVLGPGIRAIRAVIESHRTPQPPPAPTAGDPIAPPVPVAQLVAEIGGLAPSRILHRRRSVTVFLAEGRELPGVLVELGRLREIAFRAAGEGTGRALDLDRWDLEYNHLVAWDADARQILGAYRIGRVDEALERGGSYLATLFDFAPALWDEVGPALELGRAFITPSRQRGALALSDLWRGIGAWLRQQPRYRVLLGAVSIDRHYSPLSLHLMVGHLRARHSASRLVPHVTPRNPLPAYTDLDRSLRSCGAALPELRTLDEVVSAVQPDGRGIPVLFRSYMGLGARVLGVNVDPDFSDAIDALVLVDLDRADPRRLRRFMGSAEEGSTPRRCPPPGTGSRRAAGAGGAPGAGGEAAPG